jgi:5-methylcytosine-specific restriction endonuclease McrA
MTWVNKLKKLANITGISLELVKFDTQAIQNSEISGKQYQQGELQGYEVREYLLEKFNRTCAYCGVKHVPLQIEHIIPKAKGGTNRISNLTLACDKCNKAKGCLSIEAYLKDKPNLLKKIKSQVKTSLKDSAAVNSTRWELWRQLTSIFPVECGSGALTKFNRTKQSLPKTHWLDAACVGKNTPELKEIKITPLYIKSYGRGTRQVWQTDSFGFPKRSKSKNKVKFGIRTGDWVKAIVSKGKLKGIYVGRVMTRATLQFKVDKVDGIHPKCMKVLQRNDGYEYKYER